MLQALHLGHHFSSSYKYHLKGMVKDHSKWCRSFFLSRRFTFLRKSINHRSNSQENVHFHPQIPVFPLGSMPKPSVMAPASWIYFHFFIIQLFIHNKYKLFTAHIKKASCTYAFSVLTLYTMRRPIHALYEEIIVKKEASLYNFSSFFFCLFFFFK